MAEIALVDVNRVAISRRQIAGVQLVNFYAEGAWEVERSELVIVGSCEDGECEGKGGCEDGDFHDDGPGG